MLDKLGVAPDEIVHVSSSPQYDHRPAFDVGIKNKVYLDRGWEPDQPWLSYTRITDIAEPPVLFGLERPDPARGVDLGRVVRPLNNGATVTGRPVREQ